MQCDIIVTVNCISPQMIIFISIASIIKYKICTKFILIDFNYNNKIK